jgi:hypothetical protein
VASLRSVLEPIRPHAQAFQARAMARGEPGVPAKFDWRGRTYAVLEVLESRRETENERGTAADGYVRRHVVRVRVDSGEVMLLSASRGGGGDRWVLRSIEEPA